MNNVKVYFSQKHVNLGDAANPFILDKVFHIPLVPVHYKKAQLFPIGSILGKVLTPFWNFPKRLHGTFQEPAIVWTSGFLIPPSSADVLIRRLKITALRGKKTLAAMEKLMGRKIHVPLGDGGLFFPELLDHLPEIKYSLGIVPHYREIGSEAIRKLSEKFPDAKIISPEGKAGETPEEAVKRILMEIASCERILSSSLHGVIAADAFGIPNRHFINASIPGGLFKFHDYKSAFDLEDEPVLLQDLLDGKGSITGMMMQNQVSKNQIEEIKCALRNVSITL